MRNRIDPKVDCVFKALLGAEANRALLIHFFTKAERLDDAALPSWMQTTELRQAMSTLKQFSDKELAYHAYQARQNYLRIQASFQADRDEAREQLRLATAEAERAKTETEHANAATERANAEAERAKAEAERAATEAEQERAARTVAEAARAAADAERAAIQAERVAANAELEQLRRLLEQGGGS